MQFSDIPGHDPLKESLVRAVQQNHLAHAQLFAGPQGSAALPMALAFATYLNCTSRTQTLDGREDSCGTCSSCQKMARLVHPDLHFVYPVTSSKKFTGKDAISANYMPDWRNFIEQEPYGTLEDWLETFGGENKQANISREESRNIIRNLSLKAFEGRFKIMFIWLPEYMHVSAANGILKILEEPPEKTIFLLVSQDVEKLLVTILSRTQLVQVPAFSDAELEQLLKQRLQATDEQASQAARMAFGNFAEARRLISQQTDKNFDLFGPWMRLCYNHNYSELVEMADAYQGLNKNAQRNLLVYALNIFRETLVFPYTGNEQLRLQGDEQTFVERFSKVMNADKIQQTVNLLNDSLYHLERNANPRIMFLSISLRLAGILRR